MEALLSGLPYIQIALAVLLTGAILMQQRGAGLGSAFGGGDGAIHYERRGSEKTVFHATIVLAVAFVIVTMIPMFTNDKDRVFSPIGTTTTSQTTGTTTKILDGIEITTDDNETLEVESIDVLTTPTE